MKGSSTGKASPKPSAADKALARKRAVKTAKKGPPGKAGTYMPKTDVDDAAMVKKRAVRTAKKGGRYGKSVVS